ncbi:piggyBac transposable element-derived protein 1-like [Spodoptera litura]|uniref:PiggyBac transposable element-derived protein 1-like n=1 Tax=Spodoptera litura TaxID=69820 RepID=A0A9J7E304_SPOLT|nr:piggyBac transposable element-derived protein 1-like [Spodoptera litura]
MTCKRFKVLENLHLNDNSQMPARGTPQFDKLYKVRPLLELLNTACQRCAKTTTSQSIDESMNQFKGISSLKQYMPLKPIKRGYKVWTKADSETGYVIEFQIYTGKRDDQSTEFGLGANVVKCLTQKLVDEGYRGHVTFDNFFASYEILQYLYNNGIYATATVNSNRADLPLIVKHAKSQKQEYTKEPKSKLSKRRIPMAHQKQCGVCNVAGH